MYSVDAHAEIKYLVKQLTLIYNELDILTEIY